VNIRRIENEILPCQRRFMEGSVELESR
jgi:hypothetical protein